MKTCRFCAESIPSNAVVCPICYSDLSEPVQPVRRPSSEDPALRMIVPVGRSGWAIAAGYLGLLSVALVPAPLALLTGLIAVWHIRSRPGVFGMGRAIFGIVMGIIGIIILCFVVTGKALKWIS